jgi:hypothetical protein
MRVGPAHFLEHISEFGNTDLGLLVAARALAIARDLMDVCVSCDVCAWK